MSCNTLESDKKISQKRKPTSAITYSHTFDPVVDGAPHDAVDEAAPPYARCGNFGVKAHPGAAGECVRLPRNVW